MKAFFALAVSALAAAPLVAADAITGARAAHFFSSQNSSLVFGPQSGAAKASLVAQLPGDGSSDDLTALLATGGTGVPGQIVYGDLCITANGVEPGSSSQTLYVDDCSDDPKQIWTVNASPATVSNADGNCLTLGRAANHVPITLSQCNDVLQHLQLWNPVNVPE
ncbi:hypothetical protein BD309DRAFT_973151 [Dichomitus squalens]|uniref:Ricin B lectin domain-containing protein n=1 Tax=Dichomitus squalens TaxID=114155 RepID=A0A4Q9PUM0_9APHY|nr:hypothetical protein BD311DRAFT_812424 [Dichomitus squalens]TBU37836.1 hypothetical protein BD309DRAFT_973151 [Dichomitus squalens]TBU58044.1 hypothetical protein BD310DRAFT_820281 [Dichomitus squalens]